MIPTPYLLLAKVLAVLALIASIFGAGWHYGSDHVQAKWDQDKAERAIAENKAIKDRLTENADIALQQQVTSESEKKGYQDEIDNLHKRIATADRLRIPTASCGLASAAETKSTNGSNAADTGTRMVSQDTQRLADEFEVRIEEAFATCRAAQRFIKDNGFAP